MLKSFARVVTSIEDRSSSFRCNAEIYWSRTHISVIFYLKIPIKMYLFLAVTNKIHLGNDLGLHIIYICFFMLKNSYWVSCWIYWCKSLCLQKYTTQKPILYLKYYTFSIKMMRFTFLVGKYLLHFEIFLG